MGPYPLRTIELVVATIVFPSVNPADLLATLGIGSVAIGFAFKDIPQNWLSGPLILYRQPFKDRRQIVSGGFEGTGAAHRGAGDADPHLRRTACRGAE